ncbi:hypothetical protein [uncultured Aquimarina sp.]|uniref:hypothetical protein n=1 Tax=uncultured Aquimarina sp. TaxID=575652 RepID=UPI0026151C1B|nr:hypothetical protein [uncultured Aquimarina sp.]
MEKGLPEFKDDFVTSIVKKADRTTLTDDFENQLMNTIRQTHEYKKEVSSKLKTSMHYFLAGILLIGIYALSMIIDKSIFNRTIDIISILILFFSIGTGIIVLANYKRLFQSFQF